MAGLLSRAPLALVVAALAGCGADGSATAGTDQRLLLDSRPRAVHAGAYLAADRGFDDVEGVDLELRVPGRRADPVALLRGGRVNAAIMPLREFAQRGAPADLVAVMAVVQRPPDAPAGAPQYPALVLAVTRATLLDRRDEIAALIRALQRGTTEAVTDPESAVSAMLAARENLDRARLLEELSEIAPAFTAGARAYGELDADAAQGWARRRGIALDVERAFDTTLVGKFSRD
ncbi:MAG TPA: ABC transporter substrate-binding protein [Solirubrobacteraceae bacterium]|nr:ABC transporter substrate-binding protein [Solirubrobacteraceae bacterium]